MKIELEVLVDQIRNLSSDVKKLDNEIGVQGSKCKGRKNSASVEGIDFRLATVLLFVIGNMNNSTDDDKLSAYFGIVPKVKDFNETIRRGRITKYGPKLGLTPFVQCAPASKRYSLYLRNYYERINDHSGNGKAIIATARKLLLQHLEKYWYLEISQSL